MGRLFVQYLEGKSLCCRNCKTHLALHDALLSKVGRYPSVTSTLAPLHDLHYASPCRCACDLELTIMYMRSLAGTGAGYGPQPVFAMQNALQCAFHVNLHNYLK